ncbi:threonine--tRNA ligase [Candidatus Uhrbacteria bacterium]|nr:threonine--tRNA ligase [Candidatus Uhrbacteria bacterium]
MPSAKDSKKTKRAAKTTRNVRVTAKTAVTTKTAAKTVPAKTVDLEVMRHSTAHVLAAAILDLYPEAQFGVGPVVENGFYYDVGLPKPLTPLDLRKIEKRMGEMVRRNEEFVREEMPIGEAIRLFGDLKQDYKVELLDDLKKRGTTAVDAEGTGTSGAGGATVATTYRTGKFIDLCRGPHVKSTGEIGAFRLKSVAGAYWRGKEGNPMLQRVYGLAFATGEELDAHLKMLEEAERRDHRRIGQELGLFTFSNLVGPGLPLFTERGTFIRDQVAGLVRDLEKPFGYQRVTIPHLAKVDLYKTSGHWDKFEDDLFHVTSKKTDDRFVLKPMNCPHHTQIFASVPRSYRDLPIRMSEVTMVYRDENTGQIQGLSRVRSITQDDAHVFCRMDQVESEVRNVLRIFRKFYATFRMPLEARLSSHDPAHMEKYLGTPEIWNQAEAILARLLDGSVGRGNYRVEPGEAAFYGPKIDFKAKDAIGREWQVATVQLDFNLPERFSLEYTDVDGAKKRPVMLHRAVAGSIERFMSVLIEHFAGAFPVWLSPVQAQVIPVGKDHVKTATKLAKMLSDEGIRAEADLSNDTVGYKVRKSEKMRIPYMLVVGDRERSLRTLSVRIRGRKAEQRMTLKAFRETVLNQVRDRKLKP